jgi:predicted Rossmann fold nucleotide-binding protein DprA/Smf involved in DNA uptake
LARNWSHFLQGVAASESDPSNFRLSQVVSSEAKQGGLRLLQRCQAEGISFLSPEDAEFPEGLLERPGPPLGLFVRGNLKLLEARCLGVTGSRRVTARARGRARTLGRLVRRTGITLVAGWTSSCEAAAVEGALSQRGPGRILLVSPFGVEVEAPVGSGPQTSRILALGGALVSLKPPGSDYRPGQYAGRNHLLAAFSDDLVVVQAGEGSGCLEAVWATVEGGGEVWVPREAELGRVNAGSRGLLEEGACGFEHPLELFWPNWSKLPPRPTPVKILEQAGSLGPDSLLGACPGLGKAGIEDLMRAGWISWGPGGRLEAGYSPLLDAM